MNNDLSFLESLSVETCSPAAAWCPPANWEDVITGERLATNDVYRNDVDGERLIMENGDSLKINKAGKIHLSLTNGCPRIEACDGAFKVTYPNGDRILFDTRGLQSIIRGQQTVTFLNGFPTAMSSSWLPSDRRAFN